MENKLLLNVVGIKIVNMVSIANLAYTAPAHIYTLHIVHTHKHNNEQSAGYHLTSPSPQTPSSLPSIPHQSYHHQ